ncbi:MAG: DUF58 domain-containing protein [Clostridia bacterium]|nr:DUF58 domain-containing protein [Clostridia bacterium]
MPAPELFPPALLARLAGYRLVSRQPARAAAGGSWRSRLKGGTVEFADYREYSPGDEPRRVDWKAYARLRRLYVKEYLDEREDRILFLIDTSASMDFGGAHHKGLFALKLAAGLGSCALSNQDSLAVFSPGGGRAPRLFPPARGLKALPRLQEFLANLNFGGQEDLATALKRARQQLPRLQGLYVFSDFLYPDGIEQLLREAAGAAMEVNLLQILAPEERETFGEGDWHYLDAETGERLEVTLTPAVLAAYRKRLEQYQAELKAACRRWGARYVTLDSSAPVSATLLQTLVREGVLQPRGY